MKLKVLFYTSIMFLILSFGISFAGSQSSYYSPPNPASVFNTSVTAPKYIGTTLVSCVVGPAAGSGATCSCATNHTCTSNSGVLTINTGTGTTTGLALTITLYSSAQATYPNCVANSENTTAVSTTNYTTETSTGFIRTAFAAPAASTVYTLHYGCGY